MNEKMLIKNLYDLDKTIAKPLLEKLDYPWEALPKIKDFIIELGKTLDPEIYCLSVRSPRRPSHHL